MFNFIAAVLMGIIEGITEWLPVSSTAHLMIFNKFFPIYFHPEASVNAQYYEVFEVVIQLGAALAIILYMWNKIFPFGKSKNPLGSGILSYVKKDVFFLWVKIIIACIPAIFVGLFLDDYFSALFYNPTSVALALIIVGIGFIVVEYLVRNKEFEIKRVKDITFKMALYIGLFQVIAAIFPGTSRSGATIIGSLLLGIARPAAVEFTFCLAIPVMFGASLLKLIKAKLVFSFWQILLLLVSAGVAFIVSLLVIRKLIDYVKKHNFNIFGIYRIILGIIVLILVFNGVL